MARILILSFILMFAGSLLGEELLWPIPDHQYLTGGHADSRYDHFHGGVDIRTGGKNLEVLAPADGRVERIAVSPSGYGKVVYFRLHNDTTVVFGHLDRFAPRLESIVRDSQLVVGTYRVDLIYETSLPVLEFKRGEALAYTGQTGRGAPHLHFEMRKEAVQIDPLAAYRKKDAKSPVISELRFLKSTEFDLQTVGESLRLTKQRDGVFITEDIHSRESIAFLISCYDPGPWNRNAVPSEIRVIVDSDTVYKVFPTEIDLLGSKNIYAELVWADIVNRDRDVRRLFVPPNRTKRTTQGSGWIRETAMTPVLVEVVDRSGNISSVRLNVTVNNVQIEEPSIAPDETEIGRFKLKGDESALSWTGLKQVNDHEIKVGDPLDGFFDRLTLTYRLSSDENPAGLHWYKRSGNGKRALWSVPGEPDSIMSCYLMRGGVYGIATDLTPPRLLISRNGHGFKFDLRDAETGIDDSSVRCTIDGKTAIAEYEYEENGGAIWTQERLASGEHSIHFTAANKAGVAKEWNVSMTLP